MTQFLAILKDSYREAVDGFVIYLMLGLVALMVLLVTDGVLKVPSAQGLHDASLRSAKVLASLTRTRQV